MEILPQPLPWWIAGPLIGLMVPTIWLVSNRQFGISSNLRHLCAAMPTRIPFLQYDWKRHGLWNLTFALGIVLGALMSSIWLSPSGPSAVSEATQADLAALGIHQASGWVPAEIFAWHQLYQPVGFAILVVGGFLVGFGARYAGGCTSGHAITGLSFGQLGSLVAVCGFFAGGLISTHFLLPWLLRSFQ